MSIATKNGSVVSDEQLEALVEMFERGEWPAGETRIVRGRPLKFGEELASVTFKIPRRELSEVDARAKHGGYEPIRLPLPPRRSRLGVGIGPWSAKPFSHCLFLSEGER